MNSRNQWCEQGGRAQIPNEKLSEDTESIPLYIKMRGNYTYYNNVSQDANGSYGTRVVIGWQVSDSFKIGYDMSMPENKTSTGSCTWYVSGRFAQ